MALTRQTSDLVGILTRREISGRYRGSYLGSLWPVLTPLIMLGVYTVVFGVILPSRWPGGDGQGMGMFALRLLSGMLVHGLLAEVLTKAPVLITSQPNYVTKMVFPLEALAGVAVLTAMFHVGLGVLVLVLINGVAGTGLAWSQLSLPVLLAPFCLLLLGLAWLAAAFGVYIRDLNQLMGPLVTVMMFLAPVFYPRSALPGEMQPWLALNPITIPIEQFRRVVFEGLWPDWSSLGQYSGAAILVCMLGLWAFSTLRKGFADVL